MGQTLCLNAAQDAMPQITEFPAELLRVRGESGKRFVSVDGLAESLTACYESSLLPSETDAPWSRKGEMIDVSRYGDFPLAG